jgi:hypothetical protein
MGMLVHGDAAVAREQEANLVSANFHNQYFDQPKTMLSQVYNTRLIILPRKTQAFHDNYSLEKNGPSRWPRFI